MKNIQKPYYSALGRLTYAFGNLEEVISRTIAELIDINDYSIAEIVFSALSFRKTLDVVDALFRYQINDPDILAELKALVLNAGKCEELRNQYVHSSWGTYIKTVNKEDSVIIKRSKSALKRGKGIKSVVEKVTPSEICDVADFIGKTINQCEELIYSVQDYKSCQKYASTKSAKRTS